MLDAAAINVLAFWFGAPDDPAHLQPRPEWFRKDDAFDARIRQHFGALIERALAGALVDWAADPQGALAQIVVLDQFPRNAFRGMARAFAGDARALAAARAMVTHGADRRLTGVQRQFVYLPFEHAEDRGAQDESIRLFTALAHDEPPLTDLVVWAERHREIIVRFGRFPHRNALLGRESTAEEVEFLRQPSSGF